MFKNLLILIAIAILAGIGAVAGLKILSWLISAIANIAIFALAIFGILYLIKKLKSR
jgi:hypothetical protein